MALFSAFNIGKDMALFLEIHNLLGQITQNSSSGQFTSNDLGILEEFDADPVHSDVETTPINRGGQKAFRDVFEHWEGRFAFARQDATGEFMEQMLQEAFLGSNGAVTAKVTQVISHPLGVSYGSTTWVWDEAIIRQSKGGSYKAKDKVVQEYTFKAPRRIPGDASGARSTVEALFMAQAVALGVLPKNN